MFEVAEYQLEFVLNCGAGNYMSLETEPVEEEFLNQLSISKGDELEYNEFNALRAEQNEVFHRYGVNANEYDFVKEMSHSLKGGLALLAYLSEGEHIEQFEEDFMDFYSNPSIKTVFKLLDRDWLSEISSGKLSEDVEVRVL